ncbi:MAG: transporter [Flavobacteriaceae bacterium]|nr:transporter [Flavobacteriaceae bacterium]
MKPTQLLIVAFVLLCGTHLFAQDEEPQGDPELITDRPDATESPATVPVGLLQIETGAFYTSFEKDNVKQEVLGYNTTLLRYGILNNLELRLGWNFEEGRTSIGGNRLDDVQSGFSPLLAGLKVNIAQEDGFLPTIGLIGHIFLPLSASSDYRPETTGADFRLSFDHTLSETSSIAYNIGAEWGNDSPEIAYIYTLAYGYSLTDRLGVYGELYGDFPEDSKANHLWDAGFTFLVQNNLQLDATVGTSITEGQDLLVSVGASYRIPK